jgi:hypothetical protein
MKSFGKTLVKIGAGIAAFLIVLLLLLPSILSLRFVQNFFIARINSSIHGTISIQELSLGWFSGIKMQGLDVQDASGRSIVQCASFSFEKPLLALFSAKGKLIIDSPQLHIIQEKGGAYDEEVIQDVLNVSQRKGYAKKKKPSKRGPCSIPFFFEEIIVDHGQITLDTQTKEHISLDNMSIKMLMPSTRDIQLTAHADLNAFNEKSTCSLDVHGKDIQDLETAYRSILFADQFPNADPNLSVRCTVHRVPMRVLDAFCGKPYASQAIGSHLNLELDHTLQKQMKLFVRIESEKLTSFASCTVDNRVVEISSPGFIKWTISPEFFYTMQGVKNGSPFSLLQPGTLEMELQPTRFELPQSLASVENISTPLAMQLHAHIPLVERGQLCPIDLQGDFGTKNIFTGFEGNLQLQGCIQGTIRLFKKASQDTHLHASLMVQRASPLQPLLGKEFPVMFDAAISCLNDRVLVKDMRAELGQKQIICSIPTLSYTISDHPTLSIQQQAVLSALIPKHLVQDPVHLTEDCAASISIEPFSSPVDRLHLVGTVQAPNISLTEGAFALTSPFEVDLASKKLITNVTIASKDPQKKASIHAKNICTAFEDHVAITSSGAMTNISTHLLPKQLRPIGSTLSCQWNIDYSGQKASNNTFDIQFSSDFAKGKVNLLVLDDILVVNTKKSPVEISLTLTPELFSVICPEASEISLKKNSNLSVNISKLRMPLTIFREGGKGFDRVELVCSMHVDPVVLVYRGKHMHVIPACDVGLQKEDQSLIGSLVSARGDKDAAFFDMRFNAEQIFNEQGLSLDLSNIKMNLIGRHLPIDILKRISATKKIGKTLLPILGDTIDAKCSIHTLQMKEGYVQLDLKGPHFESSLDATIQGGILRLNKPSITRLYIQEENLQGLLFEGIQADHPISLTIDNKECSVPVRPFSLNGVFAKSIVLDLGKVRVKKTGTIDLLSSILRVHSTSPDTARLWFTPIYAEFRNGTLAIKRFDALLENNVHMACWGQVGISSDQVDMIVAIPRVVLERTLGIRNLPEGYMLQLPITGTLATATLDKTRASAKIAGISIQSRAGRSDLGNLLGGILEVVGSSSEGDGPIPPPTTHPLPWERRGAR